jgi:hypothetical protein
MKRARSQPPADPRRRRLALAAAALALAAAGCARVGAPEPPLKRIPPAPAPVAAVQEAGVLVVRCGLPAANSDGTAVKGYRRLEVLGVLAPPGAILDALPAELPLVASWGESTLPGQLRERGFEARLNLAGRFGATAGTVVLAVRFMNDRGRWSPPSPALRCPVGAVAETPGGVAAVPGKAGVALQWNEPAANFDGTAPAAWDHCRVLRRRLPDGPVETAGRADRPARAFTDAEAAPDRRYAYALVFVRRVDDGEVLSAPSPWLEVDTRDVFPPDAPENPAALLEDGRIKLIWSPVTDADVAGYLVERRADGEAAFVPVTPTPVADALCVDADADPKRPWRYRVIAVDGHGNRSVPSAEAAYRPAAP